MEPVLDFLDAMAEIVLTFAALFEAVGLAIVWHRALQKGKSRPAGNLGVGSL